MHTLIIAAATSGLLAVILGAFAAHGLKGKLAANLFSAFETGVQYQFYHALALLLVALLYQQFPGKWLLWSGYAMLAGIVLFSGSLYALALTQIKLFGPVTPIGGLCFIMGWGLLLIGALKGLNTP